MANQGNSTSSDASIMVYYCEELNSKKLELTQWARRRLNPDPPYTERIRRKAVEKWANVKTKLKTLLQKH